MPTPDLSRYYKERAVLENYKEESSINKENEERILTDNQKEISKAFSNAYIDHVNDSDNYKTDSYYNQKEKLEGLTQVLQKYFDANISNLENSEFMQIFENEELPKIAKKYGFYSKSNLSSFMGYINESKKTNIKFEDGILIGNVNFSQKVYYADKQSIDSKIEQIQSKIRFMKDSNESSIAYYEDKKLLDELIEYRDEHFTEKSLTDLDNQKRNLEDRQAKSKGLFNQLLRQHKTHQDKDEYNISIDDK